MNPEHPLLKSVDPSLYPVIGSLSGLLSFVKDFCGIPDEDDSDDADDDEGNEDDGTEDDLPQEEDAEPDDVELLSLKLAKAKEEIKNLKHVLAETRRKNQDVLADKNKQLKALQREHTELVDLRELVFNQESLEQVPADDTKPVQDITFPYETKKRVVVFGGHDTFLKVIKPMFPTVRFVDTRNIAFNRCPHETAHDLLTIKRLFGAIFLYDKKRHLFSTFVCGEPRATFNALASAPNRNMIVGRT